MRTVYADVVFAANFLVDGFIMNMVFSFLNLKVGFIKIAVASFMGGIIGVLFAIINCSFLIKFPISIVCALMMILICIGKKKVKIYVKSVILMYVFSALLGGVINMIFNDFTNKNKISILFLCSVLTHLLYRFAGRLFRSKINNEFAEAAISIGGVEYRVNLLCDSGNLLFDPYTSLPIIILDKGLASKSITYMNNTRLVPVETVIGGSLISVVTPEKVLILKGNRKTEIKAAVGFAEFKCGGCNCCAGVIPTHLLENI